jgi:predicted permease
MKAGYRHMLRSLEREAYTASLTAGVVALFLISLLLLAGAMAYAFLRKNNQNDLAVFVISLGGGALGFMGSLVWYVLKARERMRTRSVELDLNHPGFYDYYQQWQAKIDEITSRSD